jgi:hypothetical protein
MAAELAWARSVAEENDTLAKLQRERAETAEREGMAAAEKSKQEARS